MIEPLFTQLGFSANETRLYLLLAEMGKSTAQLLAKRAKVPRTTTYSVLQSLIDKGLVSEEQKQGTTFFIANQPASLLRLVQREQESLKQKERAAKELIEQVKPFFRSKFFSLPRIQFFEGSSAVENMLFDYTEEWRQGIMREDNIWWGYQDHTFVESYRPWLEHYWSLKTEREQVRLLSNQARVEDELRGKIVGREIRAVPPEFDFSSSIWVCGDYIVLLVSRHDPHYAFQLRDAVFSSNLRLIFRLLWELLEPSKT